MIHDYIMQMRPLFGSEEKQALAEYMETDGFLTEYENTARFEQMIAEYTGAKHCVVVNNGTISLTLAALACGVVAGDEVIVPNYTMIATPNSLKLFGAKPIFVDVEPTTLCLDLKKVKTAVTPKTKAIILVSANGRYPDECQSEFVRFCDDNNIILLEDAAQSLGSFFPDGRHIGRAGVVGSFSFSAPKIISTGQGGALITDSDDVAFRLKKLKDFGRASGGTDIHDDIGFNFKFTELQAVVGIEQMKKLPGRVNRKKQIWEMYQKQLVNVKQIKLFHHNLSNTTPWFIDCVVEDRDNLIDFLKDAMIGTRVMYPPISRQQAYNVQGNHPVSEMVGAHGLWLPSMVQLTDEQIVYICAKIGEFYSA